MVAANGISSAMQAARLVIARWMRATAATRPMIRSIGSLAKPARWETTDRLTKSAAPDAVMAAASDSAAPMLKMIPHESLLSNACHDSTPSRGVSRTAAPLSAGIAGDKVVRKPQGQGGGEHEER